MFKIQLSFQRELNIWLELMPVMWVSWDHVVKTRMFSRSQSSEGCKNCCLWIFFAQRWLLNGVGKTLLSNCVGNNRSRGWSNVWRWPKKWLAVVLELPHGCWIPVAKLHNISQETLSSDGQIVAAKISFSLQVGVVDPPEINSGLGQEFFGNQHKSRQDTKHKVQKDVQCSVMKKSHLQLWPFILINSILALTLNTSSFFLTFKYISETPLYCQDTWCTLTWNDPKP